MTGPAGAPPGRTHQGDPEPERAATPITLTALAAGAHVVYPAGCDLLGWSVAAQGADSTLILSDGAGADAQVLAVDAVAAGAASTHALPRHGIRVDTALSVVITGDLDGAVYVKTRVRG